MNRTVTVTELGLNANGDVISRKPSTIRLMTNNHSGNKWGGSFFLDSYNYSHILLDCNRDHDFRVCTYDLPSLGDFRFGLMMSAYSADLNKSRIEIIRLTTKGKVSYLCHETYDRKNGTTKMAPVIWELDSNALRVVKNFFNAFIDTYGASTQNSIAGGKILH